MFDYLITNISVLDSMMIFMVVRNNGLGFLVVHNKSLFVKLGHEHSVK